MSQASNRLEKRDQLISTAFSLFYRYGIHAVGINQVIDAAGVAKRTLYHHFESKEALIAATLAYRDQQFRTWLEARIEQAPPGEGALLAVFDALNDWFNERDEAIMPFHGCFFINTCAEYTDPQNVHHKQCQAHKRLVGEMLLRHAYQVNAERADELSQELVFLKEGAIVQAHVMAAPQAALVAKGMAKRLLQSYAT
ncbi:TetR/AcrR family transcriptional regulator [Chromohalobacter sarecensis]|uniref:TetR/AcrR family transcriptional regulator n=1 Tax=Chromohalobacter sarecensis TaxID=245294 RepID=A0ABV9D0S4_9GAMM|nr:TetR/AcrR family transcriptional regulator [Chromohalobacter sarecensis]MCK0713855.1 TetR/AcrR family transcriptional regulator [Chromohalobacter sarecensis]